MLLHHKMTKKTVLVQQCFQYFDFCAKARFYFGKTRFNYLGSLRVYSTSFECESFEAFLSIRPIKYSPKLYKIPALILNTSWASI